MPRKPTPVDKEQLIKSIEAVEKNGGIHEGQVAMFGLAADHYNNALKPAKPLTHSIVGLRVKEWNLPIKTEGMKGRRPSSNPALRSTMPVLPDDDEQPERRCRIRTKAEILKPLTDNRIRHDLSAVKIGSQILGIFENGLASSNLQIENSKSYICHPTQDELEAWFEDREEL